MAEINAQMVKELRERTGVGMGKCKEALVESGGDIELAISNLRKAGMASAVKKESREANEGIIATFESGEAIAVVQINAETDFVVKNDKFQAFARDVAEEVCATSPSSVEAFLQQKSNKDAAHTIDEVRAILVQTLGENIQVKRFEIFPKKGDHSIATYSHAGGKIVTLVELAGASDQAPLAKDIAMHIAAEAPEYLSKDDVPAEVIEQEKEIAKAQIKGKPENIIDKIVQGKLQNYFKQFCLLYQPFIKDTSMSVEQLVSSKGSNLKVTQFLRWGIGE